MNSSKKKGKPDRKTKAELQNELSNTHDIPEEPEKGPVTLRKELENAKVKITELEKQEKELLTLRKDLENLKTKITELEKQEKELLTLRKDLENAKTKITELKKREKKLVTLHKDLENKNKSLIEQIADLQKTEETFPVYSGSSKASFRIDLYPHEGHYQGKVVHLLTKEKKANRKNLLLRLNQSPPYQRKNRLLRLSRSPPYRQNPRWKLRIRLSKRPVSANSPLYRKERFKKKSQSPMIRSFK
jgi:DNA repair exonuclease SbcCD ATPase subunit